MQRLETPERERTDEPNHDDEGDGGVTFEVEGARVSLPTTPNAEECAALACAVAAHLRAEREATDDDEVETIDSWKLASRLRSRRRARLPTEPRPDTLWKYAGRAGSW